MNNKIDEKAKELKEILSGIELKVLTGYTLADAIRDGSKVSEQAYNWGDGYSACALTSAVIGATARGYIKD